MNLKVSTQQRQNEEMIKQKIRNFIAEKKDFIEMWVWNFGLLFITCGGNIMGDRLQSKLRK